MKENRKKKNRKKKEMKKNLKKKNRKNVGDDRSMKQGKILYE